MGRQIRRFLVAGFSAVGTDTAVYFVLINYISHSPAKALSFISGTFVAYVLNKFWTFEQKNYSHSEIIKFITLYASTLLVNVGVNKLCLVIFAFGESLWIGILPPSAPVVSAFLAATGTSTVLNFIGQKWWVFQR